MRSLSFRPECKKKPKEENLVSEFGADIVDRNEKWAKRKEEKLQRLKQEKDKSVVASCSFRPATVRGCLK